MDRSPERSAWVWKRYSKDHIQEEREYFGHSESDEVHWGHESPEGELAGG